MANMQEELGRLIESRPQCHKAPEPMSSLPTATVTFLFTDIEGSTRLLQDLGDHYAGLLAVHHRLLRAAFQGRGGVEVQDHGDGLFYTFSGAKAALEAAVAAQRAVLTNPWPEGVSVRIRMGLHTGESIIGETGHVGIDVHRAARISAAGHGGQILLSETTRNLVEDGLPEGVSLRDLGHHGLKDLAGPQHLFQVVAADLPVEFPPLKSLQAWPNNLPIQTTSFIGRETEKAEIKQYLSTTPLVSITGAGGAGKTRLALQVAAELVDGFKDGAWLVELAPFSDPELVPQTVASVLGVREQPGRTLLSVLIERLHGKQQLLVLDNCEHLITACAHLAHALLVTCRDLRILATTREPLGIAGEIVWRIPSLSLPELSESLSTEQVVACEAVRLFVERAKSSQPKFVVTAKNAIAIAQICRQLDGIPLALELAAARVRTLSVEQLGARLTDRFRVLTGGKRTALPRHQTLRAAIDWSYDLLSEKERILLRRLSVFSGGWTLEAAESICSLAGVDEVDILDLLDYLVDKSLVLVEHRESEARYGMLETIRQYCWERLIETGEASEIRRRHLAWFLAVAEAWEPNLRGPDQGIGLDTLEIEHDNLRKALEWAGTDKDSVEAALRLAGALERFWVVRGYFAEGRTRLEEALSRSTDDSPARAKALHGAGVLAGHQGDYEQAEARSQAALALWERFGSKRGIALALNTLGLVARHRGNCEQASDLLEKSLALGREVGDKWALALTLNILGVVARSRGNYERAMVLHEESRALRTELGDQKGLAVCLERLGVVAMHQGDAARAKTLFEQSLALSRDVGDRLTIASATSDLGLVAQEDGDFETARTLQEESLAIFRELGDKAGSAACLRNLARLAQAQGDVMDACMLFKESLSLWRELGDKMGIAGGLADLAAFAAQKRPDKAAALLGASKALCEAIAAVPSPSERADYARDTAVVRSTLGEDAFTASWEEGQAMTMERAIESALSVQVPEVPGSFPTHTPSVRRLL